MKLNINFNNFKTLGQEYSNSTIFENKLLPFYVNSVIDDTLIPLSMKNVYIAFLRKLIGIIYLYYARDKIAYEDVQAFEYRLNFDLANNVNRYFQLNNISLMLAKNTDEDKYILTSKMDNTSSEKGVNASSVLQSTASTPTGVNPSLTGSDISIDITNSSSDTETHIENNGYVDKYTNFQGKTNGLHKNDITKDNEMIRSGNFLTAIELMEKLPKTYIDEVLKDVSKHFILIY